MNETRFDWNGFWKNLVIAFWIAGLLFLVISGNIDLFIKKSYLFLPIAGSAILGLMLFARLRKTEEEERENPWILILLVVPLIFGLGVRPESLGEFAISRKGLITGGMALSGRSQEDLLRRLSEARAYQHLSIKEILSLNQNTPNLEGLKIHTEGMATERPQDGAQHYYLVRFLIWCCAADAQPLAVELQKPDSVTLPSGKWFEIWGTLHSGPKGLVVKVEKAEPIPTPYDPYLY